MDPRVILGLWVFGISYSPLRYYGDEYMSRATVAIRNMIILSVTAKLTIFLANVTLSNASIK